MRVRSCAAAVVLAAAFAAGIGPAFLVPAVAAQAPAGPGPGEIATDPIRCWWKTDRTSIRIGERFGLTLTCGVIETPGVTVVAATTQLDPGAIQLAPFEVVGGERHEDLVSAPWRYIQYDYTMRLLGEGFFGQDVTIPPVQVTYNIQTAAGNGAKGRDLQYNLPPLHIRALSIVPRAANDIRDASPDTFAAIESRRFVATSAFVASAILFGFAGVLVVVALVRVISRTRGRQSAADRPLPASTMLHGGLRALRAVKAEAGGSWTPALARRALAALRVAAAIALDRPVAQAIVSADAEEREGQVAVRTGLLKPKRILLSAAVTPFVIEQQLSASPRMPAHRRDVLERLQRALHALGAAAYGRATEADPIAMTTAIDEGIDAIRQLRFRSFWPMRASGGAARTLTGLRETA